MGTPTIMEMEECVGKNKDVFNDFLETDKGKDIESSAEDIISATVRALNQRSIMYDIRLTVGLLHTLIMDTPVFGMWLGSRPRRLQDPTELVAYNLAYFLYKKTLRIN